MQDLGGLTAATRAAFEAARAEALWRDGELIGLTSGYRDPLEQARLFHRAVAREGSFAAASRRVLPPHASRHVTGTALDIRPTEGAQWLERHGERHGLYRTYDRQRGQAGDAFASAAVLEASPWPPAISTMGRPPASRQKHR